jgi:hypothetical protein
MSSEPFPALIHLDMQDSNPAPVIPRLAQAMAAVEAAYRHLATAPQLEPQLLEEFEIRTRELTREAQSLATAPSTSTPSSGYVPSRIHLQRRCAAAEHGASWILAHIH